MLHLGSSDTVLWVDLLKEAEERAKITLTENQESYLVFMLMRFIHRYELLGISLALQYLESIHEKNARKEILLSDTADASLLLAGLFPERAQRLNVSSRYFIDMSQMCFLSLANLCESMKHTGEATLYREVASSVQMLAQVLHCTRIKNTEGQLLFQNTRSGTLH